MDNPVRLLFNINVNGQYTLYPIEDVVKEALNGNDLLSRPYEIHAFNLDNGIEKLFFDLPREIERDGILYKPTIERYIGIGDKFAKVCYRSNDGKELYISSISSSITEAIIELSNELKENNPDESL